MRVSEVSLSAVMFLRVLTAFCALLTTLRPFGLSPHLAISQHTPSNNTLLIVSHSLIWRGTGVQVMEHGGFGPDDISVPIIVSHPFLSGPGSTDSTTVYTTQIAPTIMQLLGLEPSLLQVWAPTSKFAPVR